MLKNDNSDWEEDQTTLKNMKVEYFKNLYFADTNYNQILVKGAFPELSLDDKQALAREINDTEVKTSIFSMGGWKALGPDGLPTIFFQTYQDHVGQSLCNCIKDIFLNPHMISEVNGTFLSLPR